MKKAGNIELVTVGKLLVELKGYEKKCSDYVVNIDIPDGSTMNVMGAGLDTDGDLSIEVDDDTDEGRYDIRMLIDELDGYEKDIKVYMEGCGLFLNFQVNPNGGLLSGYSDEDEIVGFDAYALGEYKYEPSGWFSEAEKREKVEKAGKRACKERTCSIILAVMAVAVFFGLCYNVFALIAHTGQPVWESALWIVMCVILLVVCVGTLFCSKDN